MDQLGFQISRLLRGFLQALSTIILSVWAIMSLRTRFTTWSQRRVCNFCVKLIPNMQTLPRLREQKQRYSQKVQTRQKKPSSDHATWEHVTMFSGYSANSHCICRRRSAYRLAGVLSKCWCHRIDSECKANLPASFLMIRFLIPLSDTEAWCFQFQRLQSCLQGYLYFQASNSRVRPQRSPMITQWMPCCPHIRYIGRLERHIYSACWWQKESLGIQFVGSNYLALISLLSLPSKGLAILKSA